MKDVAKLVGVILVMLAMVGGPIACSVSRWRECRRVHPRWYCLSQQ